MLTLSENSYSHSHYVREVPPIKEVVVGCRRPDWVAAWVDKSAERAELLSRDSVMLVVRCVFITARAPKLVTLVGTGVTPVLERTLASTHPVTSSQITGHCRHWHSLAAPGWHDRLTG